MQFPNPKQESNALLESSQQFIERVWRVGTEILKFYAPLNTFFSSVFETLLDAINQGIALRKVISELSLARFAAIPQYEAWIAEINRRQEEFSPMETGVATLPMMFNLTLIRRILADSGGRKVEPMLRGALSASKALQDLGRSELESLRYADEYSMQDSGFAADAGQRVREIMVDFQAQSEFILTPGMKTMFSAAKEYGARTASLNASLTIPEQPLMKRSQKMALERIMPRERLVGVSDSVPSRMDLSAFQDMEAFKYAVHLPNTIFYNQAYMPPRREPSAFAFAPSSLMTQLSEQVLPFLSSWIYGESEQLRGVVFSLSAVPIAASAAQNVVMEALTQPISQVEEYVFPSFPASEHGYSPWNFETARLQELAASAIAIYEQGYEPTPGPLAYTQAYGRQTEMLKTPEEEFVAREPMPEMKEFSKLPAVLALAAAQNLIAHKLRHESAALMEQVRDARLSYSEELNEMSASAPMQGMGPGEVFVPQTALSTIEPYYSQTPPIHAPAPRLSSISPTIQNTFNVAVPVESTDEDLRNLEAKIGRILADQMRRYYGSTRI